MATIKSINAALPRFDEIRRNYMLHGETGIAHGYGFFSSAYADLDDAGNVSSITLYTVGDAMAERHYYDHPGTVNITEEIEHVLSWEYRGDFSDSSKQFRNRICHEISDRIGG